jgi:hypothetical protein
MLNFSSAPRAVERRVSGRRSLAWVGSEANTNESAVRILEGLKNFPIPFGSGTSSERSCHREIHPLKAGTRADVTSTNLG